MVLHVVALDLAAGALLAAAWYLWFLRWNRSKGKKILGWIEQAFANHGQIAGVRWEKPACFHVRLRLTSTMFQNASLIVRLFPRQTFFGWLLSRTRHQRETLTFQADLDAAPSFNLEVHNHRWWENKLRRAPAKTQAWNLQQAGPFVLTTRNDWQREVTAMMSALVASRECDCLSVSIRRTPPHFSATVPLATLAPDSPAHAAIFDVLRELASGASTARF
jgi:hypothetical protein